MEMTLNRLQANMLYTEGELKINGEVYAPYTVENTHTMIPIGKYRVCLAKVKKEGTAIGLFLESGTDGKKRLRPCLAATLALGNSYLNATGGRILIGEQIIPGALKCGYGYHARLLELIAGCHQRDEQVALYVVDKDCVESTPARHWLNRPCAD